MEQPARGSGARGRKRLSEKLLDDWLCRPGDLAPSGEAGFMGIRKEDRGRFTKEAG